ncbi:hypothetical protein [Nostoc sp. 'Peltigera membranacea cyanobiont' 232]|uniref:hypothetical protein n=1 Tax=Nostoc sp. 'Peltigera membranacea cyanobiont' 232 TaxID=2014531 RepID=UPI000B958024|nr:hypothetical protein [Nostoc sp. 'Peltigera membranacea cyanobiont' 232]OYE00476.1 hypothetical protein CDG79_34965 [Nostoc sp. 'Peltigera membranacea cyanobiont' 232]
MRIAKRDDWKTEPMPSASTKIALEKLYSQEEFDRITAGVIPEQMEDKWFIFYEAPWIYFHRSWTGFCIFKVRFEVVGDSVKIAEVQVNRDPAEYSNTDDKRNASMLLILLNSLSGRDLRNEMLRYIKGQ